MTLRKPINGQVLQGLLGMTLSGVGIFVGEGCSSDHVPNHRRTGKAAGLLLFGYLNKKGADRGGLGQ